MKEARPNSIPRFEGDGMKESVTRAIPSLTSDGKSGLIIVTPGNPLNALKLTFLVKVTGK